MEFASAGKRLRAHLVDTNFVFAQPSQHAGQLSGVRGDDHLSRHLI